VWENVQATTDSAGTAVYSVKNAQPDCYSTDVENVIAGLNYDDLTDPSDDESCKSDNVTSKGSGGSVNYL